MDPKRFKEAYERLQLLDERSTYRVRMKPGRNRLTVEQLEDKCRDLAQYTVELKEILDELFKSIASQPKS